MFDLRETAGSAHWWDSTVNHVHPKVKNMFRYIRDSFRDVHTVHTNVMHTWGNQVISNFASIILLTDIWNFSAAKSALCVIPPLPFMFQSWHLSVVTGLALGEPLHVRLRCELMVISFFSPRSLLTNSWPWGCSASTLTWPPTISWCPIGRPCTTLWR